MFGSIKTVSNLAALATTGLALVGGPGLGGGTGWGGPDGSRDNGSQKHETVQANADGSRFRIDFGFGDRGWGSRDRDRGRYDDRNDRCDEICEVAPAQLELRAFQIDDQVMVYAQGSNRTGGFITLLERCDTGRGNSRDAVIHLRNYTKGKHRFVTQCLTPFEVTGSIRVRGCVEEIKVLVAGEYRCVRVCQVNSIPRG